MSRGGGAGGSSPEAPGNSVSLAAPREFAEFSWGMGAPPRPDPTAVHSQWEVDPAFLQGTPVFPCSQSSRCILSQGYASSTTNARPLIFPSLTQCLQEDFKFLLWRLFLALGLSPCLPLSCTHTCSVWNWSWGGSFLCSGRHEKQGL